LEAQRQAISERSPRPIRPRPFALLVLFLELGDGVMDRCSEQSNRRRDRGCSSKGAELGACASARQAKPDAPWRSRWSIFGFGDNGYGQFDGLIARR